eukprot:Skav201683  [mRNA]  locus=scaffold641:527832:528925:- [translate_table: standard]
MGLLNSQAQPFFFPKAGKPGPGAVSDAVHRGAAQPGHRSGEHFWIQAQPRLVPRPRGWRRGCGIRIRGGRRLSSRSRAALKAQDFEYKIDLEGLVSLCKRRGFVFPSGEIYGGYSGFFDYGPLGAELKNNLKRMWWRRMVHFRDDVIGLDSSIVTTPSVHQASGHVDNFSDPMVDCTESKRRFRADQLMWAKVELEDGTLLGYVSMVEDGDVQKSLAKAAKKLKKEKKAEGSLKELTIKDMTEATEEEASVKPSCGISISTALPFSQDFC